MRFTTRAIYNSIDDFINGRKPATWEGFEYDGPVAELKKGRGNLQSAANAGNANTAAAQGIQGATTGIAKQEVNTTGGLSPVVAKQLANEKGQIGKAYSSAAAAADRGLTMRGMGSAPSGMTSSIKNTSINNEGQAETGATGNAFGEQERLNQTAYNPAIAATNAVSNSVDSAANAGKDLNQAGSTLGDIGSGLSGLAGMFGAGGVLGKLNPYKDKSS